MQRKNYRTNRATVKNRRHILVKIMYYFIQGIPYCPLPVLNLRPYFSRSRVSYRDERPLLTTSHSPNFRGALPTPNFLIQLLLCFYLCVLHGSDCCLRYVLVIIFLIVWSCMLTVFFEFQLNLFSSEGLHVLLFLIKLWFSFVPFYYVLLFNSIVRKY